MKTHEVDGAERWSRRQFLVGGVAAGLAAAGGDAYAAAERPLKLGFLGTGYSHFAEKYRVIRENPDFELIGLAEADATVRARGPAGARWWERERLLAEAEVIVVEGAVALVTSAPLQPNAGPQRHFEVLRTAGTARVQPLEPPGFTLDLGRAAGPHPAGRTEVPLPAYRRYVDEFRELAAVVRGRAKLGV